MTDSATVSATILDGKAAAAEIRADLTGRVARLREQGIVPGLGTVLVGDDPGSRSYVAGKHRDCAEVGLTSLARELPARLPTTRPWRTSRSPGGPAAR